MKMQEKVLRIIIVLALGIATLGFIAGIQVASSGVSTPTASVGQVAALSWTYPGVTLPGGPGGMQPQVSWNG